MLKDSIYGGMFGLLVGDALGVPFEFHSMEEIPQKEQIEYELPPNFKRTYPGLLSGTWSDDGAQALCLLESLLERGRLELEDFADKLAAWHQFGKWAVNHIVFDCGMQTGYALTSYVHGTPPYESGFIKPDGKGNGALMRVLPLALWHKGVDEDLVLDAHTQCLVTHGHLCNQVSCAFYCLIARKLLLEREHCKNEELTGEVFQQAYRMALDSIRSIYKERPEYLQEFEWSIRPDEMPIGRGSGYVVDCLHSAVMILLKSLSYEDTVKSAIALGNDTDTTAAVTGGLAGILFGYGGIPKRWLDGLQERDSVLRLLKKFVK